MSAGVPISTAAAPLASTTFPAGSTTASGVADVTRASAKAAASSVPLWCARCRSLASVAAATRRSHGSTVSGSGVFQQEMLRTASGSSVTTSRTATPAHAHGWKPWHQCSGPLTMTGRWLSSAVPMPLVPQAHSDQVDQGARLLSAAR